MQPPHDPLDPLLDCWSETPEPPPRLAEEVWRRIAVVERPTERSEFLARIEAVFSRPSFATAFVMACLLLGMFLAEMRLSRLHAERGVQLAQSYLRLIDPLLETPAPPAVAARRP